MSGMRFLKHLSTSREYSDATKRILKKREAAGITLEDAVALSQYHRVILQCRAGLYTADPAVRMEELRVNPLSAKLYSIVAEAVHPQGRQIMRKFIDDRTYRRHVCAIYNARIDDLLS